jgi:hypothetical protein
VSSYTTLLIERFRGKGVLIDTNLLLVYVIGSFDKEILRREAFDRVAAYSVEDYDLLRNLTSLFHKRVTTPHVLADVSNWIGYLPRQQEIDCLKTMGTFLDAYVELQSDSVLLARERVFPFLGLTDTALASVADEFLIVTDDARFVFHLNEMGKEALNINHLRQEIWLQS